MLGIFNNDNKEAKDVKRVRDEILLFIKEKLRKAEGGEGKHFRGLQLYVCCSLEEKPVYEAALHFNEHNKFKEEEIQRIADDYAVELPADWNFEIIFVDALPPEASRIQGVDAGLFIVTKKSTVQKSASAYLKVRVGEAEKQIYKITSTSGRICIGREKQTQTANGFYRQNDVAFVGASPNNKFISRQHAHIEFDNDSGNFMIYADEGGVPPGNKIKVRSVNEPGPVKLYTTNIGHPLKEGDQILLGETALLEFSYSEEEKAL
ncbi:MAG: FHA domain-containing protein [Flavisolibacter sp.]|jgi:pSer/pThr/pTyr-binding forkhead associated (FHA) protein|nr:FHA domain-containing protein [Flavisolibacter sp.]